jgi:hypothetical protein
MSRNKSDRRYSRAEIEVAVRNLAKKGQVVIRIDNEGREVFIASEFAPPVESVPGRRPAKRSRSSEPVR